MSFRSLDLTADAERDIRSILRFTRATWGVPQRDTFARQLRAALHQLTRFPDLGERKDHISPELRARLVGQHVVYYRVTDQAIKVLRVLHVRMDAADRFAP